VALSSALRRAYNKNGLDLEFDFMTNLKARAVPCAKSLLKQHKLSAGAVELRESISAQRAVL
jgi:hypothetical protein